MMKEYFFLGLGGKPKEDRNIFFWVVREGHKIELGEKVL